MVSSKLKTSLDIKKTKRSPHMASTLSLHIMLIPALLLTFVYSYIPMLGIGIAFQKFNVVKGIFGQQKWCGFDNFIFFFNMPDFTTLLYNTVTIAVMKIVVNLAVPLFVALLLNEVGNKTLKRGIQTIIYLPHFVSWVILSGILVNVLSLNGIVNNALGFFGLEPIFFLGDDNWFKFTVITSHSWKEFGWGTIIYLATMTGIDPSLYEAARIDGAGRLKQTWHVTLPSMRHIIVVLLLLSLGQVLNAGFDQIFNLYSPIVYKSGDIIDTAVYRIGMINSEFGLSTAIGLFKSVISSILISSCYYLAYKYADYRVF